MGERRNCWRYQDHGIDIHVCVLFHHFVLPRYIALYIYAFMRSISEA